MKTYLKVRKGKCTECKEKGEIVVKGKRSDREKENKVSEVIIGYCCKNCGRQQLINYENIK